MNKGLNPSLVRFGVPLILISFLFIISRTTLFLDSHADLSLAILLDLLITLPLVFFFLVRNTAIPKISVLYTFILGILIAGLIIPIEHQALLKQIKYIAIPVVEIFIISLIIYKISKLSKSIQKIEGYDFYDKVLIATEEVFSGKVGKLLATEIAVIYYLFKKTEKHQNKNHFSSYKKSGIISVISVVLFLVIVETFVVHLLVAKRNETVAWILTSIGVYTILQIVSILKSLKHRLISIDYEEEVINLRYGFASQSSIPFRSIKAIEKTQRTSSNEKSHISLSIFDLFDSRNASLFLHEEQVNYRMYGIKKNYKSISVFIDEIDTFAEAVEKIIKSQDKLRLTN